jgi:diguanylate cyclase (GGDEF)-like protein
MEAMGVDVKTLVLINLAVLLLSAAISCYFWYQHRDNVALLWWASGTTTCSVAIVILSFTGPEPPKPLGLIVATLIIGGFAMAWEGIRRFDNLPAAPHRAALIVLIFVSVLVVCVYRNEPMNRRLAVLFVALSSFAGLSCWQVLRGYKHEPLGSRLPMACFFAVMAVTMALRTGLALFRPGSMTATAFFDPMHGIASMIVSICIFCISFSIMMMANERVSTQYRKRALTDELTGLPNRRSFLEQAEQLVKGPGRDARPASILMMDLDHFSQVNERFGHDGGDQALRAFARLLSDHVRPTDIVARYGGEEFCAILLGVGVPEATPIAERLRATLAARAFNIGGQLHKITVSIGVAALRDGDLQASLRQADEALYGAKAGGRDQVVNRPSEQPDSSSRQRPLSRRAFG